MFGTKSVQIGPKNKVGWSAKKEIFFWGNQPIYPKITRTDKKNIKIINTLKQVPGPGRWH